MKTKLLVAFGLLTLLPLSLIIIILLLGDDGYYFVDDYCWILLYLAALVSGYLTGLTRSLKFGLFGLLYCTLLLGCLYQMFLNKYIDYECFFCSSMDYFFAYIFGYLVNKYGRRQNNYLGLALIIMVFIYSTIHGFVMGDSGEELGYVIYYYMIIYPLTILASGCLIGSKGSIKYCLLGLVSCVLLLGWVNMLLIFRSCGFDKIAKGCDFGNQIWLSLHYAALYLFACACCFAVSKIISKSKNNLT